MEIAIGVQNGKLHLDGMSIEGISSAAKAELKKAGRVGALRMNKIIRGHSSFGMGTDPAYDLVLTQTASGVVRGCNPNPQLYGSTDEIVSLVNEMTLSELK